ncbi:MAG: DUF6056 family protein [Lachnospiraceae bacterium]|nr:DUF6056 family protein [Lachnospiraceae bacterium]
MKQKILFIVSISLSFMMIFLYNFFTPHFSDDLQKLIEVEADKSIIGLLKLAFNVYLEYNPRIIGQFSTFLAASMDKILFTIINSIIFALLVYLIYLNVNFGKEKRHNAFLFLFTLFFFWRYAVEFGDTMLWLSGAASYLWPMAMMLAFITFYRCLLATAKPYYKSIVYPALFILAVFSGWCNENTSGGTILLVLIFTAIKMRELKKDRQKMIRPEMIIALAGAGLGFIALLSSPGAYKRLEYFEEEYTGMTGLFQRLYHCFNTVNELFFELLIIFIIFTILAIVVKKKLPQVWLHVFPFFFAGAMTAFVLILIPQPMARAYFGAGVFLIIACLQSFMLLFDQSDTKNKAWQYIIFAVLALWLFFDYQANLVNLARINREENERILIIEEVKNSGGNTAIVPKYREAFRNRYSSIHRNDMTDDPLYWINQYYQNLYEVENIIALPRDIWDCGSSPQ